MNDQPNPEPDAQQYLENEIVRLRSRIKTLANVVRLVEYVGDGGDDSVTAEVPPGWWQLQGAALQVADCQPEMAALRALAHGTSPVREALDRIAETERQNKEKNQ